LQQFSAASVIAVAPSQPSTIYLGAASAMAGVPPINTAGLVGVFRSMANGDAAVEALANRRQMS
jgi:hypothetical protein